MAAILFFSTQGPSGFTTALRHHGYTVTEVASSDDVRQAVGKRRYGLVIFEVPTELDQFRHHYSFVASILADTPRVLLLDCRQKKQLDQSHPVFDLPLAGYQLIQKPIARFDFVDRIHSICGCRATNANRIGVAIPIEAFDGKNRYEGHIRNISSSGLRLSFPQKEEIVLGDIFHVRFGLEIQGTEYVRAISAIAEVVWAVSTKEKRGIWPWRRPNSMAVGMQFSQMNYDDKAQIKRFVEREDPAATASEDFNVAEASENTGSETKAS